MENFYKTKLTIEVEVSTQFGPNDAINVVKYSLNCPAVDSVTVTKVETDYKLLTPQDLNQNAFKIPIKLK